jgi:predicted DNA-binding protein
MKFEPRKEEHKHSNINFRLTPSQRQKLDALRKKYNLSISQICRQMVEAAIKQAG